MNIRRLRKEIDHLDRQLVKLWSQRAKYSLAIGRMKQQGGQPLFIRKREQEIARKIRQANRGPLPDHALTQLYKQLLRHTRAMVRGALRAERRRKSGAKGKR